jgi:tetratricopeptide (TPR) repeat protein
MKKDFTPYIGPRFFEKEDKNLFFGRDYETRELCSRIIAHSVVLCYAQSGAGKTSLINAGVIPRLEEEGFDILPVARVSGQVPPELNPNEIKNIYAFNSLLNWTDKKTPAKTFLSISINEFLKNRKELNENDAPQLIIFDQFEELITHYLERWTERKNFFEQVVDALEDNPRLRVAFVMREDYIAYLDPYIILFPNKLNIRFRLERMKRDASISAIVGPINKTKINYSVGVPEYLVDELLKVRVNTATGETIIIPGEYIEPVQLQVVCQNLWSNLPDDVNTITKEYVETFGSVNDALREFYDQAISSVVSTKKINENNIREWFEKQLITMTGTRGTVYRGPVDTGGISNEVIDELQSKHIIRAEWRAGGRWYELTHDSLIKAVQDSNKLFTKNRKNLAEQNYLAGLQNLDQNRYKDAVEAFDRAIELNPDYMLAYANKAYTLTNLGEYEKALQAVNRVLEIDPDYAWALGQRGKIYNDMKEYHKALIDLDKAIEMDSNDKYAYANKSYALGEIGEYEKSIQAINRVLEIDPDYAWAYNQRARLYIDLKKYEEALKDLDKTIKLDNKFKWAYANKSLSLNELGNYDEAFKAINKAIELDQNYGWAYGQRARIYINQKDFKNALPDTIKAIELGDTSKETYGNKSYSLSELGENEKALEEVNKALGIDPDYAWAYNQRARIYIDLKDYKNALKDLDNAISLDNNFIFAYANKSLAHNELGENDKALEAVNKAIELDSNYAWAYGQRGKIYNDTGDYKNALISLDKAIELNLNENWVIENKTFAESKLKKN